MKIEGLGDLPPYRPWNRDQGYSRSFNTVCSYVRILNHLGQIVEGLGVEEPTPDVAGEEAPFTPHLATYLKLLLAMSYARNASLNIGPYVTDKLYYLDILSASGLTYPDGGTQPLPASCFCVPLACQDFRKPRSAPSRSFDRMWAFDSSVARLDALKRRHDLLGKRAGFRLPPLTTIAGDANVTLRHVLDGLKEERGNDRAAKKQGSLALAFIDNVGLDVRMETIHSIQRCVRADLVVHLPLRAIWRAIRQHKKTSSIAHSLTEFFGSDDGWKGIASSDEIPAAYQESVQVTTPQEFQEFDPVHIRSANQEFALCVFARRTKGMKDHETGWVGNIRSLAGACNTFTPDTLERVLDVATSKQRTLNV